MSMFHVIEGGVVVFGFQANFDKADSPVQLCEESGSLSDETPFRVSDAQSPRGTARLINDWRRTNGRKCWAKGARGLILRRVS